MRAVIALPGDHFWRRVARRAAGCLQGLPRLVGITQSKVDDLDVLVVIKEKIFGFEISVYNIKLVEIFNTSDDLMEELEGLWLFDSLILDNIVE